MTSRLFWFNFTITSLFSAPPRRHPTNNDLLTWRKMKSLCAATMLYLIHGTSSFSTNSQFPDHPSNKISSPRSSPVSPVDASTNPTSERRTGGGEFCFWTLTEEKNGSPLSSLTQCSSPSSRLVYGTYNTREIKAETEKTKKPCSPSGGLGAVALFVGTES